MEYNFLENNFFNSFKPVETPEVKIQLPLMDDPIDISEWSSRVTENGVPIIKDNTNFIHNNPEISISNQTPISISADKDLMGLNIMNNLISRGFKPHEAAGIVGNLYAESGFNSTVTANDLGVTGGGLAGFRGENLKALQNFAKKQGKHWGDLDTQLDYIQSTISPEVRNRLSKATNAHEASEAWAYYERYAGYDGSTKTAHKAGWSQNRVNKEHQKRSKYSNHFYDLWKKSKS